MTRKTLFFPCLISLILFTVVNGFDFGQFFCWDGWFGLSSCRNQQPMNISFGQRVSNDTNLGEWPIEVPGIFWPFRVTAMLCPKKEDPRIAAVQNITYMNVINKDDNPDCAGSNIDLLNGGPGQKDFFFTFESAPGCPLHYVVQMFGFKNE